MRVFIAALVLIFSLQSFSKADDIRDFEIEGMSIGDSLLDYFSEKELINGIRKDSYKGSDGKFIDINLTANFHLIKTLSPLLLHSNAGRALFLTSGVSGGRAYWGGYAVTKTALEAMVRTWSEEMTKTKLKINMINPGGVRTQMRASAYPGEDPLSLPAPEDITEVFVKLAETQCEIHGQTVTAE